MLSKNSILFFIIISLSFFIITCSTDKEEASSKYKVTQVSSDMAKNLADKIRDEVVVEIADDLELSLWASDTLVNDPIAISVDEKGRIYYTLATRLENSEFDIRSHRNWMTASISFQSVEDRRDFLRKTFSETNEEGEKFLKDLNEDGVLDWRDLTVEKEQIWLVADSDQDGIADRSQLYIEDFNEEVTDLANGVEYHNGEVYLSVGPDLWRMKDTDGDDLADEKESISHGFAVHIGFGAHGMSGVTVGPQGRIWWGIGDIGMNVTDKDGKNWKYPNRGVVVRSEPDGSNFEVYAHGVRNTHEFVFDKYGNLISEDNDGDHGGERERLVYLIDGSDTGWRINWQFGKYTDPDNNKYKVWMDEKMGVPRWDGQAAYFLPPIQNYVNGPTGMVYNPGTALSEKYRDHFFISEFRGSPANSPIHAFTLKPDGASFALDTTFEVAKGLLPTGLDFGPDGALYFGDWIDGWGVKKEGRIWKLDVPGETGSAIRKEVQQLIQENFEAKSSTALANLLEHSDMRIRRKAQFALVERGEEGFNMFVAKVNQKNNQLARVHSIWGIAQLARTKDREYGSALVPMLNDEDSEIVTQAVKMLGDVKLTRSAKRLIPLLRHESLRVQLHATEALGRIEYNPAFDGIVEMLETNDNQDAWLRHAGMIALGRLATADQLAALNSHDSRAVQIAAVVALRRQSAKEVAIFLKNSDEYIVTEAARAINDDFSIEGALPDLAEVLKETKFSNEALIRRAINANMRVGQAENLQLLVDYLKNKNASNAMKAEALAALSTWAKPSPLDRVDGRYRGEITRDPQPVRDALALQLNQLLGAGSSEIKVSAAQAIAKLNIPGFESTLFNLLKNSTASNVRKEAILTLHTMNVKNLGEVLEIGLTDSDPRVRSTALEILPGSDLEESIAVELLETVLKRGTLLEQQAALHALGNFTSEAAVQVLDDLMEKYNNNYLIPELHLDLMEAIENQNDSALLGKLKAHQKKLAAVSELEPFKVSLVGGKKQNGRDLFYEHEAAQCTRCHAVFEVGGNVGPNLKGVGIRLTGEQLLESLVAPSATLSKGFGVVSLELKDGKAAGTILEETEESIKLKIGKQDIKTFNKSDIVKRQDIPSSMPSVANILTKREIRDLVAYLKEL